MPKFDKIRRQMEILSRNVSEAPRVVHPTRSTLLLPGPMLSKVEAEIRSKQRRIIGVQALGMAARTGRVPRLQGRPELRRVLVQAYREEAPGPPIRNEFGEVVGVHPRKYK